MWRFQGCIEDKQQIIAVFTISLDGSFLSTQMIYCGKSHSCLLAVKFPLDWHTTLYHYVGMLVPNNRN